MDKVQHLGQIVRAVRKSQKLTQEQMTIAAGVGARFIRELEQGKESCHIGKTLEVLSALGIDVRINGETL